MHVVAYAHRFTGSRIGYVSAGRYWFVCRVGVFRGVGAQIRKGVGGWRVVA